MSSVQVLKSGIIATMVVHMLLRLSLTMAGIAKVEEKDEFGLEAKLFIVLGLLIHLILTVPFAFCAIVPAKRGFFIVIFLVVLVILSAVEMVELFFRPFAPMIVPYFHSSISMKSKNIMVIATITSGISCIMLLFLTGYLYYILPRTVKKVIMYAPNLRSAIPPQYMGEFYPTPFITGQPVNVIKQNEYAMEKVIE